MAHRSPIDKLNDDTLLQIFSCYRLEDGDNWYLRVSWRKLVHVCQRWRYLIYNSCSHLDMCLLLTNDSLAMDLPSHLRPLPLVIACLNRTGTTTREGEDNVHLGLQQHGRVRRVALRAPSSSLRVWLEPMNKLFPMLRDLSLWSTTKEMSLVLPESLQAPDLRRLSLHGIGLPKGLPLLSSTITLSKLSLTHIRDNCYFPPGHLVSQLQGLPSLEELSIGFAIPIPIPSREGELLPAPIPPVTLPSLRRLTFRGLDVYLDNLVAQINTPVLERLGLTLLFDVAFILVNLNEFIHRTEGFECLVARVIFNKSGVSIDAGNEQRGIGKLSLHVDCKPLDWQIDSVTQVSIALGKVLSAVEELALDLDVDGMPSDWENTLDNMMWRDLLSPFIGVRKLRIGSSFTLELSQALGSVPEELVLEILPELQELEVPLEIDQAKDAFSLFVKTRESMGHPVHLTASPNYQAIVDHALRAYKKKTGRDLTLDPLLRSIETCQSYDAVLAILRIQIVNPAQPQRSRNSLTTWLDPTVFVLNAFSGSISGFLSLAYPLAGVIFTGIGVLLSAARSVSSSRDLLIDLFNRIENIFRRLKTYIGVPQTPRMVDVIVKVMVEVLSILAIVTKEIEQLRAKSFLTKLVGRTDIDDALERLTLTIEEAQMEAAIHGVGVQVVSVDDRVKSSF